MGDTVIVDGMRITFYYEPPERFPLLSDVHGTAREFLEDILFNIQESKTFENAGISPRKSYLLEGLPGTGKSFSVSALNNILNASYLDERDRYQITMHQVASLPKELQPQLTPSELKAYLYHYHIGKYGTAFINRGSRVIEAFFENAYHHASKNIPVILVFDEADALLMSRKTLVNGSHEDYKNLETLMKKVQEGHDTPYIYMIFMTNYRDRIDDAALRAGRIDMKYTFDYPDSKTRMTLLRNKIETINQRAKQPPFRDYHLIQLVQATEGLTHADIVTIIENTVRNRIYYEKKVNKSDRPITVSQQDLLNAIIYHKQHFKEKEKQRVGF